MQAERTQEAELRSALRVAHRRLVTARELLAFGMTGKAAKTLARGAEEAAKALDSAERA